jgi:hypothetical protein
MSTNVVGGGLVAADSGWTRALSLTHVAVADEGAVQEQVHVGRRLDGEISVGRQCPAVARRQEEILAALALVWPRQADIGDEAEVGVIHWAQHSGRNLDDDRAVFHVDAEEIVDRGRVRREEQRACIHQLLGEADALILLDALEPRLGNGWGQRRGSRLAEAIKAATFWF